MGLPELLMLPLCAVAVWLLVLGVRMIATDLGWRTAAALVALVVSLIMAVAGAAMMTARTDRQWQRDHATEPVCVRVAIRKPGPHVIQIAGRDVRVIPLRKRGCCLVKTEAPVETLH